MWKGELKKMRLRSIVMMAVMAVLLTLVMTFKDWTVQEFSEISKQLSEERIPKFLKKLMGSNTKLFAEKLREDDFYLWSQWFGKNFGQFVPLISLIIAFPLFSREYERRTIYYLVTRVRRSKIYMCKFFVGLIALCFILLLFSILPLPISLMMGWKVRAEKFVGYTIQSLIGGVTFYSIFLLFSVLFNDQVKPILLGIATTVGVAFFGVSSKLDMLNLYSYIMSQNIFRNEGVDLLRSVIYTTFSAFMFGFSWIVFEKKEL